MIFRHFFAGAKPGLLWGALGLLLLLAAQPALAIVGSIQNVLGVARVSKHTGQQSQAIKGQNLYEGDTVSTDANANVQIRMIDEALVWVRPNTRLKIEKYRSDQHGAPKNEAALRLLGGSLRTVTGAIGKSDSADYRLSTPNATIGIRGTEFDALYATPQIALDLNTPPGTYNRVYAGSTALEGPSGRIVLNKDEAGFMGLQPSDTPRVLPSIPNFLTTLASSNPRPVAAPSPAVAATGSRQLLISVRYGDASVAQTNSSQRDNNSEQRVQAIEGERASLTLYQATGSRQVGQGGARAETSSVLTVVAEITGGRAVVQFFAQQQTQGVRASDASKVETTLSVPVGVWTEVSGKGPWSSGNTVTSSSRSTPEASRIYLKVDEVRR